MSDVLVKGGEEKKKKKRVRNETKRERETKREETKKGAFSKNTYTYACRMDEVHGGDR
jgi:hypothetical protein